MKASLDDLAIFGGQPIFPFPLHVGRPHIGDREALRARLEDALERRWLTNNGRHVQELERRVADHLGVEHCVATCNGTTALQIAARAANLTGEVIVPSFTFVATVHALEWLGLTPVFCDIDPDTHNIDPQAAERLAGDRVTGIVGVHLWGRPCATDQLSAVAERHGLKLIFDAAHAFGCSHMGRMIGGFGDAEVFSFHATKVLNAAEGGAITTSDAALAARARLMTNFGFAEYDQVVSAGTNGKMSELSAAMGLTSLESVEEFIAADRRNFDAYRSGLDGVPGISLVEHDDRRERRTLHHVVVEVASERTLPRDALHRVLWAENVLARRYFFPGAHRMEPYRTAAPNAGARLPATERLADRTLVLPSGGELGAGRVMAICDTVRFACGHGPEIVERLARDARS